MRLDRINNAATAAAEMQRYSLFRLYNSVRLGAHQLLSSCLRLLCGRVARAIFHQSLKDQHDKMPQEMNVLCCYSCYMYQVHIVKKSNKWQCKICGEKQSIQVVYFRGSGSDCRKQVQHLNLLKNKTEDHQSFHSVSINGYGLDCVTDGDGEVESCSCSSNANLPAGKWAKYLETSKEEESSCESSDEKENLFLSEENSQRHWKLKLRTKRQCCSLPASPYSGKIQCELKKNYVESEARISRSRTYPLVDNSPKICGKWDKFLNNEAESCSSKATSSQNETPVDESISSRSPSKKRIFENLDDDLDIKIDF